MTAFTRQNGQRINIDTNDILSIEPETTCRSVEGGVLERKLAHLVMRNGGSLAVLADGDELAEQVGDMERVQLVKCGHEKPPNMRSTVAGYIRSTEPVGACGWVHGRERGSTECLECDDRRAIFFERAPRHRHEG